MTDDTSSSEGDVATRVPLSEVITAVPDELDKSVADVQAIRHRLRQREVPGELDIEEEELPHLAEHVRKIAADLETYATVLRNASGKTGEADPS